MTATWTRELGADQGDPSHCVFRKVGNATGRPFNILPYLEGTRWQALILCIYGIGGVHLERRCPSYSVLPDLEEQPKKVLAQVEGSQKKKMEEPVAQPSSKLMEAANAMSSHPGNASGSRAPGPGVHGQPTRWTSNPALPPLLVYNMRCRCLLLA